MMCQGDLSTSGNRERKARCLIARYQNTERNDHPEVDEYYFKKILDLAKLSLEAGTYPVAAILVRDRDGAFWEARNCVFEVGSITAHAEMLLLGKTEVGLQILHGSYTLYSLLAPCDMCIPVIRRATGIRLVKCLMEDDSVYDGIYTLKPFSRFFRRFMKWLRRIMRREGYAVKIRRRSPEAEFVVRFLPESNPMVKEATVLWGLWLARAAEVKAEARAKWN